MENITSKHVSEAFEEGFRMARQEHEQYPSEKQWDGFQEAWEQSDAEYHVRGVVKTSSTSDRLMSFIYCIFCLQLVFATALFFMFKYYQPS